MKTISILVADDHPVVRVGVRSLLETNVEWKVLAEASDGREAVEKARKLRPDLAVLDISMPLLNGLESARKIARQSPNTRVLILTMYGSEEMVEKALDSGAHGLVRKSEAEKELIAAVRAVLNDKLFFPSKASQALRGTRRGKSLARQSRLTPREAEILQLIAEGRSNKEAASLLGISRRTAENHRARIMRKLGLSSLSDLVRYAVRNKVVAA
jgi:DNA-binding NarL/FixJ family response regulator